MEVTSQREDFSGVLILGARQFALKKVSAIETRSGRKHSNLVEKGFNVDSMEALAKASGGFGSTSVLVLILTGYMGLAGTAFWAFNKRPSPFIDAIEDATQSAPALICDCHYQKPASCPVPDEKPSAQNTVL